MGYSRRRGVRRVKRSLPLSELAFRCVVFLLVLSACALAVRWISHSNVNGPQSRAAETKTSFQFADGQPSYGIQPRNRRIVYPYSVVPGGVRSAAELREAVKHDPVVAQHYSGFDYSRAHVIEVERPRLVYVSYRRGAQIHWTSRQATLRVGERLLTDGHITARTRCGNQVSVLPQSNTTPNEPTMAELERPDAVASGREELFPQSSNALHLDPLMPVGPPYAGFPQPGPFLPLPFGGGGTNPGSCAPIKKNALTANSKNQKNNNCNHTPPPPPPVPEPGSFILVLSGAAAVYARLRTRRG